MLNLIALEWKKWSKHLGFRLLILFYVLLLPSILLLGKQIEELPPPLGTNEVFFIFPTVWEYQGYIGNWLCFFFLGFLSVLIITTEYSNRTLRQNIITGLSRKAFFLGKIYFILAICLGATLYYVLCVSLIGFFNTEVIYVSKVFQNIDYVWRYFLMCFGYMTIGFFLGLLIKRTGIALFLYLSYVMFLEAILRYGVHMKLFQHKSMHFYPMNAVEDLIPIPFTNQADFFLKQNGFELFLQPTEAILTTVVYIGLFLFLAYRFIMRADL